MSLLTDISELFPEPLRSQVVSEGVQIVYVLEAYIHALRSAKAAGLEVLLQVENMWLDSTVSFNHYWPPLRHNNQKRETPELFHTVEGLGGVSEPEFSHRGVCVIVDNSVDTGGTLWMAHNYLASKGYRPQQVLVAAEVWHKGKPALPFEVRPLAFFEAHLKMAPRMLAEDIGPFLNMNGNSDGHSAHDTPSLQQMLAAYCKIF